MNDEVRNVSPLYAKAADRIEALEAAEEAMRLALEQIKIVCADNAASIKRHDLALEFVGGIATRALAKAHARRSEDG